MASSSPFPLLSLALILISTFSLLISPSSSAKFTLPLSLQNQHSSDPLQTLTSLASASLSRAHALKHPKPSNTSSDSLSSSHSKSLTKTPLFPRSYGGYSVSLRFGTPLQTLQFVMDTGSSLVWFPCTSRYLCSKCSAFPNSRNPARFLPKQSSSAKLVGCENPKCQLVLGPAAKCGGSRDDQQKTGCPAYVIQYGSGSTIGLLLSETLHFPKKTVPDFLVGCSILSIRQPSGIVGFGRGKESLPSQLGLAKFSYCLVSHRFDDTSFSSDLVLYSSDDEGKEEAGVNRIRYTPFQKNPASSARAFKEYYYVLLRKVTVGGNHVKIPYKFLVPGSDGNGGAIVDSGSTFTFLEKPVYDAVSGEFAKQMANYTRAKKVEKLTGLSPCFDVSKEKSVNFPELVLQFKGGAKMELPLPNYFSLLGNSGAACLTLVTNNGVTGPETVGGPAIILGNYQQQNFHIEYDLKNDRFGFRRQTCK